MGCYLKLIPKKIVAYIKIFQKPIFFFVCVEEAKTFAMKLKTSESTYR